MKHVPSTVGLGLCALLAVSGCSRSMSQSVPSSSQVEPSRSAWPESNDSERSIDLAHVTVERFARMLGPSPVRSFHFVRDCVAWEPYRGALRGARGTLLALAGNSLDRALLLRELLSAQGHQAVLVRGTLPLDAASRLASTLFPTTPPDKAPESDGDESTKIVQSFEAVVAALASASGTGEDAHGSLESVALEAGDHCWVRCSVDGSWVDMDPTFPDAEVGRTLGESGQSHTEAAAPLPFLVHLRILTRTRAAETERTAVVYEWKGEAMDLAGEAFVIEHVPARGGAGSTVGAAGGLISALSQEAEQLRPLVTVAGKRTRGEAFPVGASARAAAPPAGGTIPGLDRFRRPATPPTVADREWLEIEFTRPDGSRHRSVRLLHDAAELADSAGMRSRVTVVSIVTGVPSRAHFPREASQPPLPRGEFEVWRLLRSVNLLLVAAPAAIAPGFVLPGGRAFRYVIDTPQVIVSDVSATTGLAFVRGDLRAVSQRVVTNFDQTPRGQALARVLRGVIDTRVEADLFAEILGDGFPSAGGTAAATVLDLAAAGPESLQPLAAADLDALPLCEGVRDLARGDLEAGYLLVGARHPVDAGGAPRAAWWRVDPRTGGTIGVLDTGLHQTGTEVAATDEEGDGQAQAGNAAYSREMQRGTAQASKRVVEKVQRLPGNNPVQANDYGAGPNLFEMPMPRRPPGGINTGDPIIPVRYPSRGPHDWWNALF